MTPVQVDYVTKSVKEIVASSRKTKSFATPYVAEDVLDT
jgi:hypothetical protein